MEPPVMNHNRAAVRAAFPVLAALVIMGLAGCTPSTGAAAPSSAPGQTSAVATSGNKRVKPVAPSSDTAAPQADTAAPAGTVASSAGTAGRPCGLVSRPEAEKLAGTSLSSPVALAGTCTYTAPPDGPTAQVEIFVGETAENYLAAERGIGHDLQPLSGIGDEAYFEDAAVFVRRAAFWVSINLVRGNDPAENSGPLKDLARTVADRI
ncbi:hypothetical protein Franean1_0076 [Parafrankia sp. EAN1pec]|nr:hypothetical protein Franean1_0076 [Frankia sp. EAN1pec]